MTGSSVGGMLRAAIAARTGRERAEKVDFRYEINMIAGAHRALFHEILARVAGEAGAHEDVEHVMHKRLGLVGGEAGFSDEGAGQVGMAAVMILPAA